MQDKFFIGLGKVKGKFIFAMILWILISLLLICPLSTALVDTLEQGVFDISIYIPKVLEAFKGILTTISKTFSMKYLGMYWSFFWKFSLFYIVVMAIGLMKAMPKGDYGDIEHGSSDWSHAGEQYSILNSKKGIILAEKNYLPIDKRGNVNILVVGRFRFW